MTVSPRARRALAVAILFGLAAGALAHEEKLGGLLVIHPHMPAVPGPTAAIYMAIANDGERADRLLAVATPVAEKAVIHRGTMDGDIMRMRPVAAVDLPAGETVVFEPGGLHVMLVGLRQPLKEGDSFPLMLSFENDRHLQVTVLIEGRAGTPAAKHHGLGKH